MSWWRTNGGWLIVYTRYKFDRASMTIDDKEAMNSVLADINTNRDGSNWEWKVMITFDRKLPCSVACCRRSWATTTLHRKPDILPGPTASLVTGFCSGRSRAMEQFTATSQRCWLTAQSVPAVTKDIFVWIVRPQSSVNYFDCAV